VQRREYRKHTGVIASAHPSLVALILGIVFLPGGSYVLIDALRDGVLTVNDTGLHLHQTFGTRHIPWDAVRGFQAVASGGGCWVRAILRTKKVTMYIGTSGRTDAERIAAELTEAAESPR